MYDTLEEIAHFSLTLQERGMTLTKADKLMRRTIRLVSSMIATPGEKRQEAPTAAERLEFCGTLTTSEDEADRFNNVPSVPHWEPGGQVVKHWLKQTSKCTS